MKRLFIAINLLRDIKEKIAQITQGPGQPAFRWLLPENWHLTIIFLGHQPDEAIQSILNSIKETVKNFLPPMIEFEKMILAPPQKQPRMVWLCGVKETSENLAAIKKNLENVLVENGVRFHRENREYSAHLTLARFRFFKEAGFPKIKKLSFAARSLDLMESRLKRAGAEYERLAKVDFIKKV